MFRYAPTLDRPAQSSPRVAGSPSRSRFSARVIASGLALLALVATMLQPVQAQAQDSAAAPAVEMPSVGEFGKPVVVVSIAGIEQLIENANYLTRVTGNAQAGAMFAGAAGFMTNGIDDTRPIGLVVPIVDGAPSPIAFIPTSDVRVVLETLEAQLGPADELSDGTLAIVVGNNEVYIRQTGDWAYVAQSRAALKGLPSDPLPLLLDLPKNFDLGVQLNVQAIPAEQREMLLAQIRQGFEQSLQQQQQGGQDPEQIRRMGEMQIEQLENTINDTDVLQIGLAINPEEGNVSFELTTTAVAGSELAEVYAGSEPAPSRFASVIREDAAGYVHAAGKISEKAVEMQKGSLQSATMSLRQVLKQQGNMSEDEQEEIASMIDELMGMVGETMEEGKSDFGAMLLTQETKFQFVVGMMVSDGAKAAEFVQKIAAKVSETPDAPEFSFNEGEYNGVTMHSVAKDIPESEEEPRKVFGDKVVLKIGTAEKAVFVALGRGSEDVLKKFIDTYNEGDAAPMDAVMQMNVAMEPILIFAQSIESNDSILAMIEGLARANQKDNVSMVANNIKNGSRVRFTVEEGVMRAIGASIKDQQRQAGGF